MGKPIVETVLVAVSNAHSPQELAVLAETARKTLEDYQGVCMFRINLIDHTDSDPCGHALQHALDCGEDVVARRILFLSRKYDGIKISQLAAKHRNIRFAMVTRLADQYTPEPKPGQFWPYRQVIYVLRSAIEDRDKLIRLML